MLENTKQNSESDVHNNYVQKIFGCPKSSYSEDKKYDISVLICSYNPKLQKILMTISSALIQKNVKIQVVICDDGSKNFPLMEIQNFFNKFNFKDYVLCLSRENHGTVKNIINGIEECKGEYVKDISPGDYLNGEDVLFKWFNLLKNSNADFSICDAIYYCEKNGEYRTVCHRSNPQANSNYFHNQWFYDYLILDDIALGACMLCKTSVMKEYLLLIEDKVKFTEDNIFRIMAADKVSMVYFHNDAVLYEYGTGISTSNNTVWNKRIKDDFKETDKIISGRVVKTDKFGKEFIKKLKACDGIKGKIYKTFFIKGYFFNRIKTKLFARYTDLTMDKEYLNKIKTLINKYK